MIMKIKYLYTIILLAFTSLLFSQKTVEYKNEDIEGVVFTKEYFNNSLNSFTPFKCQLDKLEKLLSKKSEKFSDYVRQYQGIIYTEYGINRIEVQLISKDDLLAGKYKEWKINPIIMSCGTMS